MKNLLRKIFRPVLNVFESGEQEYNYKGSHRKILVIVGALFLVLSVASAVATIAASQLGGLFPCFIFFLVAATCILVGTIGNDRAVAKIWGSK